LCTAIANYAALTQVKLAPVGITVFQFEGDRALRFGPAASDFVAGVFKAVRQENARPVLRASDGIANGLTAAGGNARCLAFRSAAIHVDLDANVGIDRLLDLLAH